MSQGQLGRHQNHDIAKSRGTDKNLEVYQSCLTFTYDITNRSEIKINVTMKRHINNK